MALSQNCILNNEEINHKIRRIAYQIYESNVDENEVILAGIQSNGYILAEKIKKKIEEISFLQLAILLEQQVWGQLFGLLLTK